MTGLEKRMGRMVNQNAGISMELLLAMLENMGEEDSKHDIAAGRKRELIICVTAFVVLFSAAL